MGKSIVVWAVISVLISACGGKLADAEPFCGDGVKDVAEECDDGNTDDDDECAACHYTGPKTDDCGLVDTCGDGRFRYRCVSEPAVPIILDGTPVLGCTDEGADSFGLHQYCCEPTCVRLSSADKNCAGAGKWVLCPAGDDHRSAIGEPGSRCELQAHVGVASAYCCE